MNLPVWRAGRQQAGARAGWALALVASLIALLMVLLMVSAPARADTVPVPAWTAPVMDLTHTLDAGQRQALATQLQKIQSAKGSQLYVLLVPTTGDETIEQYARRVFDQWQVGRKGVDDGVLLLVALQDRTVRIDVGYGLEGAITDAAAGRIIREQITPRFAQGQVFEGLQVGVDALQALMAGEALPPPASAAQGDQGDADLAMAMPLLVFLLVMPMWLGAVLAGGFVFMLTNSWLWAVLGAVGGVLIGGIARALGITSRLANARRSRRRGRGDDDGFGGGGFGGGFGGGGGSGGGGGGRGGGGGASGSW